MSQLTERLELTLDAGFPRVVLVQNQEPVVDRGARTSVLLPPVPPLEESIKSSNDLFKRLPDRILASDDRGMGLEDSLTEKANPIMGTHEVKSALQQS